MHVSIISQTPEAERLVAAASRLCYAKAPPDELLSAMTLEEVREYLARLSTMEHFSPFEHAVFTFAVTGVSRALTHELVRHRIASYTQRSQRYLNESGFGFVTPPKIADHPEAAEVFARAIAGLQESYARLLALGIPREDARFLLPNACQSQIMVTMNARGLRNFFALRCCNRAQWEIRVLAGRMLELSREAAPGLFAHAGPACETDGFCRQSNMGCGRFKPREEKAEG